MTTLWKYITLIFIAGMILFMGGPEVEVAEAQAVSTESSAAVEIFVNLLPEEQGGKGLAGIIMDVSIVAGGPQELLCLPNPLISLSDCRYLQVVRLTMTDISQLPGGLGAPGDMVSLGWVIVKGQTGNVRNVHTNVYQADSLSPTVPVHFPPTVTAVTIP